MKKEVEEQIKNATQPSTEIPEKTEAKKDAGKKEKKEAKEDTEKAS